MHVVPTDTNGASTYVLPTGSKAWESLKTDFEQQLAGRIEEMAREIYESIDSLSDQARARGLKHIEIERLPRVVESGPFQDQYKANYALARRVAELVNDLGYESTIYIRVPTVHTWAPASAPRALEFPFLYGARIERPEADKAFLRLEFADKKSLAEALETQVQAQVLRLKGQVNSIVQRLQEQGGSFACVALFPWDLDLPVAPENKVATAPAVELQKKVWARLVEDLSKEWKVRGDIAWRVNTHEWQIGIAYLPQGTTRELREHLRKGEYQGYQTMNHRREGCWKC